MPWINVQAKYLSLPMEVKSAGSAFRHVRTPAGVARYKQPIGALIIADALFNKLRFIKRAVEEHPSIAGNYTITDNKGRKFDVFEHDDGKWYVATHQPDPNKWGDDLDSGDTPAAALLAFDERLKRTSKKLGIPETPESEKTTKAPVRKKAATTRKKTTGKARTPKAPAAQKPIEQRNITQLMSDPNVVKYVRAQLKIAIAETTKDKRLTLVKKDRKTWAEKDAVPYDRNNPKVKAELDAKIKKMGYRPVPPAWTEVSVSKDLEHDDLAYRGRPPIYKSGDVSPGSTMTSLTRKYHAPAAWLKKWNPELATYGPNDKIDSNITKIRVPKLDTHLKPVTAIPATQVQNPRHAYANSAIKYRRIGALDKQIGKLDNALATDTQKLDDKGDTACAVLLMRRLGMRPSSEKVVDGKKSYGATTLLGKHVKQVNGVTYFDFIGKEQVHIQFSTDDPEVFAMLQKRLRTRKGNTPLFATTEDKTNDYLRDTLGPIPGEGPNSKFSNKDLRTLKASQMARKLIQESTYDATTVLDANGEPDKAEFDRRRMAIVTVICKQLGNTPKLVIESYVNPSLWGAWNPQPEWLLDDKLLKAFAVQTPGA